MLSSKVEILVCIWYNIVYPWNYPCIISLYHIVFFNWPRFTSLWHNTSQTSVDPNKIYLLPLRANPCAVNYSPTSSYCVMKITKLHNFQLPTSNFDFPSKFMYGNSWAVSLKLVYLLKSCFSLLLHLYHYIFYKSNACKTGIEWSCCLHHHIQTEQERFLAFHKSLLF